MDYVQSLLQGSLDTGEKLYMNLRRELYINGSLDRKYDVLQLKKNLYDLKQSNYSRSELLKAGSLQLNFK